MPSINGVAIACGVDRRIGPHWTLAALKHLPPAPIYSTSVPLVNGSQLVLTFATLPASSLYHLETTLEYCEDDVLNSGLLQERFKEEIEASKQVSQQNAS
jgi:hypothetical protein